MRSRRDFLLIWKSPRRDLPQTSTKPRNVKVSGLSSACNLPGSRQPAPRGADDRHAGRQDRAEGKKDAAVHKDRRPRREVDPECETAGAAF